MDKEEKLLSVKSELENADFDDVFRIYLNEERGKEKTIAMIISGVVFAVCIVLFFVMNKNITFIFYGIGGLIVGISYMLVPVNRKFIATNRLMFGLRRETTFYPHAISTMELYDDEDPAELTDEEREEATTYFSTHSITAYENTRAFLFAEGKISSQFLYVPKKGLNPEEIQQIQEFAQERCSGGYYLIESAPMVEAAADSAPQEQPKGDELAVDEVCGRFYGADRLHLHDDDGHPLDLTDDDEASGDAEAEAAAEIAADAEADADAIFAEAAEEAEKPAEEENPADE